MLESLPYNKSISVKNLTQIFNNTSASYKYYWFISILQLYVKYPENKKIKIKDILIQMICNAWYPVNYFKLSFGYSDKLHDNIVEIQRKLNIPIDISHDKLFKILKNSKNRDINKLITHFNLQVPYRFLSPWIPFRNNSETIKLSQDLKNNCLYKINKNECFEIQINPNWKEYLFKNYKILLDFSYWNLITFVQSNNLNIPNIADKLVKPIQRKGLGKQRKYWELVFDELSSISCIYTGETLYKDNFDMEHFIPWSFVSHNQLWNLLPADSNINSSKSNKLPKLSTFLKPFVEIQREAIRIIDENHPNSNKILEDYLFLETSISKILKLSEKELSKRFQNTLEPLIQIASNSGFQYWDRK